MDLELGWWQLKAIFDSDGVDAMKQAWHNRDESRQEEEARRRLIEREQALKRREKEIQEERKAVAKKLKPGEVTVGAST